MKKAHFKLLALMAITLPLYYSCNTDDGKDLEKPVITALEAGHNDTIHIGEPLHLEFDVSDNDKLDFYRITIHADENHKSTVENGDWDFDSTFTEINQLKNSRVHHHYINVPETAEHGVYHLHLSVADISGNVAEIEKELYATDEEGDHDDH